MCKLPTRVLGRCNFVAVGILILAVALPQVAAKDSAADRGSFEAFANVKQEFNEIWQDFWCWLWGKKCDERPTEAEPEVGNPVASVMHAPMMDTGPLLNTFCGMDLSNGPMDCGCCADHLVDPLKVAALLHGSMPVEAPAWERNDRHVEKRLGRAIIWSVGGRTPTVWCDRGRPVCRCEDPKLNWDVDEAACRQGKPCAAPEQAQEKMNFVGDQKRIVELETELQTGALDQKQESKKQDTSFAEVQGCMSGDVGRIPIGSAQCEDMSPAQCDQFYAKDKQGWHLCAVLNDAPRICSARQRAEDAKEAAIEGLALWSIQQAYNPDLGWATEIDEVRLSLRVNTTPGPAAEQVRANLRERISAAAMASKLHK
mmetsp:Transcript_46385/g.92010  ORF Transcript_46385/g.92010 Transcript_46385/m.92010 type:complete len:370 (+) Transcript_46385:213-1322(+)